MPIMDQTDLGRAAPEVRHQWLRTSSALKTMRPAARVLVIAISNPPYNLLNGHILGELSRVLRKVSSTHTGAIIITSSIDDIFLSHYDVQEIVQLGDLLPENLPVTNGVIKAALGIESFLSNFGMREIIIRSPLAGLSNLNVYHEVTELLRSIPQVTIAAINGRAFGGGCELALACDFRIMVDTPPDGIPGQSRGSGFGQPEIVLGLMPGGGGTQMLTRTLGPAKALELCIDGRLLSAQEAHEYGLINKVVPREQLMKEAIALATRVSKRAPSAVAQIKHAVHHGASGGILDGMREEQAGFAQTALNPEARRAMRRYLDRIDTVLGPESTSTDFKPLLDGTMVSFVPGDAARKRSAARKRAASRSKVLD